MTMTNAEALRAIETSDLAGNGLLSPDQRTEFYKMMQESSNFWPRHRVEVRRAKTGQIDRFFVAGRKLRKRTENVDANVNAKPTLSAVEYALVGVTIDFDITEETLQYGIEGEGFANTVINAMAMRFGSDVEDLHWNGLGDDAEPDADDYDFLKINEGWLAKIVTGGNVVDGSTINGGSISKAHLFAAIQMLLERYKQRLDQYVWIMTSSMKIDYEEYLTDRATSAGDAVLIGQAQADTPLGIPIVTSPYLGLNIVLCNPMTLISTMSGDVTIRSTTEGREAIRQNKRLYAIHADTDPIIEEVEGVVVIQTLTIS